MTNPCGMFLAQARDLARGPLGLTVDVLQWFQHGCLCGHCQNYDFEIERSKSSSLRIVVTTRFPLHPTPTKPNCGVWVRVAVGSAFQGGLHDSLLQRFCFPIPCRLVAQAPAHSKRHTTVAVRTLCPCVRIEFPATQKKGVVVHLLVRLHSLYQDGPGALRQET